MRRKRDCSSTWLQQCCAGMQLQLQQQSKPAGHALLRVRPLPGHWTLFGGVLRTHCVPGHRF